MESLLILGDCFDIKGLLIFSLLFNTKLCCIIIVSIQYLIDRIEMYLDEPTMNEFSIAGKLLLADRFRLIKVQVRNIPFEQCQLLIYFKEKKMLFSDH